MYKRQTDGRKSWLPTLLERSTRPAGPSTWAPSGRRSCTYKLCISRCRSIGSRGPARKLRARSRRNAIRACQRSPHPLPGRLERGVDDVVRRFQRHGLKSGDLVRRMSCLTVARSACDTEPAPSLSVRVIVVHVELPANIFLNWDAAERHGNDAAWRRGNGTKHRRSGTVRKRHGTR